RFVRLPAPERRGVQGHGRRDRSVALQERLGHLIVALTARPGGSGATLYSWSACWPFLSRSLPAPARPARRPACCTSRSYWSMRTGKRRRSRVTLSSSATTLPPRRRG